MGYDYLDQIRGVINHEIEREESLLTCWPMNANEQLRSDMWLWPRNAR